MNLVIKNTLYLIFTLITLCVFTGCDDEDLPNGGEPIIYYVRATDPAVADSLLTGAYQGNLIALIGDNLGATKSVWFNDQPANLSPVYVTSTSILVNIPAEEIPSEINNKITLYFANGDSLQYDFEVFIVPRESSLSPLPIDVGAELTITGVGLDLVSALIFPKVADPVTTFVSQSATEIKVIVPADAAKGFIRFVTIHGVQVTMTAELQLTTLAPLLYTVYSDALENGWQDWGWGGARDFTNTEVVFDGASSIRKTYDGTWDAVYFGGGSVATGDYETFVIYAYGGGSTAANVQLAVNSTSTIAFTVPPGIWTEINVPVANVGIATWTDVVIQGQGTSGVVYYDYIGFR